MTFNSGRITPGMSYGNYLDAQSRAKSQSVPMQSQTQTTQRKGTVNTSQQSSQTFQTPRGAQTNLELLRVTSNNGDHVYINTWSQTDSNGMQRTGSDIPLFQTTNGMKFDHIHTSDQVAFDRNGDGIVQADEIAGKDQNGQPKTFLGIKLPWQ